MEGLNKANELIKAVAQQVLKQENKELLD